MTDEGSQILSREPIPPEFAAWIERQDLLANLAKVQPFTMVSQASLVDLAHQVHTVLAEQIPGNFVECGVWRGGASFLMAELLRRAGAGDRKVWLFDSFEGLLPSLEQISDAGIVDFNGNASGPWYFDHCLTSLEEVQSRGAKLGLAAYTELVKGWFDQTLPAYRDRVGPIAILRIDCDWYSSVRCCLDNLYDQVVDGGFVIFDDYYTFDGCAIAVHEFLGEHRLAHRIESVVGDLEVAVFRKGKTTWTWVHRVYMAAQDIAAVVPQEAKFILVDEDKWGTSEVVAGRHRIPFLEHDGEYWGKPSDDHSAIRELERLCRAGARFVVFGWPAFWWLDYYSEFHRHLCSQFRCVLENERLIIFDLRPDVPLSQSKQSGP